MVHEEQDGHIRAWSMTCGETSYLWNASFYIGKKGEDEDGDKDASVKKSLPWRKAKKKRSVF